MLTTEQLRRVMQALPFLQDANQQVLREFESAAFYMRIPPGKDVFLEGDQAEAIALLLSGMVRVYKIGETGREITLYRFGNGESCILTANAILSQKTFPAIATTETEAEAVMIPAATFREWVKKHDVWREFVFELLSDRLATVMAVVDEVVFQRMDRRVAALLLQRAGSSNQVRLTHQEIAAELGSSREVVSRIIEDFVRSGLVGTARGTVEIFDPQGLTDRSGM